MFENDPKHGYNQSRHQKGQRPQNYRSGYYNPNEGKYGYRSNYSAFESHANHRAHNLARQQFRTYDTSALNKKQSNAPTIIVLILVLALIVGGVILAINLFGSSDNTGSLPAGEKATVVIPAGSGAKAIGTILQEAGLVANAGKFAARVQELNAESSLQAGTYTFIGGVAVDDIISALQKGAGAAVGLALTIPEGYTLKQIAARIEKVTDGSITAKAFMAQAGNASVYAKDFPFVAEAGTNSLEGFLYPETYDIAGMNTSDEIIRMMLSQFSKVVSSLDFSYPTKAGLTKYQALKLASVVQGEAGGGEEDKIASVFYNRLAIGMYLESDATTAYEVGGEPTADQVHADTPYSTYANPGLEFPTPIGNPGIEALKAVCKPATTDYYYFVAVDDGTGKIVTLFARTEEEHIANYSN